MAWSWAGVPSGPLGWISANWITPVLHGPIYPVMASALALMPGDDLLEVACGSGIFLAGHAGSVHYAASLDCQASRSVSRAGGWPQAAAPC